MRMYNIETPRSVHITTIAAEDADDAMVRFWAKIDRLYPERREWLESITPIALSQPSGLWDGQGRES